MCVELPVFKRCCFCCPLRPGLMTWGYIKLVLTVVFPIFVLGAFIDDFFIAIPFFIDSVFIVIFLISAHRKNYKLMRVYYYYSIAIECLGVVTVIICAALALWIIFRGNNLTILILSVCLGSVTIATTVIQIYMTLMIRSEILKLKNNMQCKFIKAPVSEESGDMEEQTEKVRYDRFHDDGSLTFEEDIHP